MPQRIDDWQKGVRATRLMVQVVAVLKNTKVTAPFCGERREIKFKSWAEVDKGGAGDEVLGKEEKIWQSFQVLLAGDWILELY